MKPLTFGSVLIAGAKASNFDDEIKNNPRVIMWDSQKRWANKELPQNVRAVFTTKWIGHAEFEKIMKEARKRKITIFPCEGTGQIAKMVMELLTVPKVEEEMDAIANGQKGKLTPLVRFIDANKTQKDNALFLIEKAKELNIETTIHSVTNLVYRISKKEKPIKVEPAGDTELDLAVRILDNSIKELSDMRAFLIATTQENARLKARIDKYKRMLEED